MYPRIILAGTHSGTGKTTVTLGLISALKNKGYRVQPFKVGPDYIDPSYHSQLNGSACRNLDSWLFSKDAVLEIFQRHAQSKDISIIEGVMGLYDGFGDTEKGSTAHIAKILNCPVILIMDAKSMSRSAAAAALGFKKFDPEVNISGIILNNVSSERHFEYLKNAIEQNAGIPVLGSMPKDAALKLDERHLGLVPAHEKGLKACFKSRLTSLTQKSIDINKILKISRSSGALPSFKKTIFIAKKPSGIKIAVAFDSAFNFYYQDNLDILQMLGSGIVKFSPLRHKRLPENIHGLYIGGGYPELFCSRLSGNTGLKKDIYKRSLEGLPIYAECGGLMYLVKEVEDFKKRKYPMAGIFNAKIAMASRLQALGYVTAETVNDNILSKKGDQIRSHIFHWSYLKDTNSSLRFAYRIKKNKDKAFYDGLIKGNTLASYSHIHFASNINFARNFIGACRRYKNG